MRTVNVGPAKTSHLATPVKKTTIDPAKLDPASPPDGFTNASVNQALTTGALAKEAAAAATKFPSVHELQGELKSLYESAMGKVSLAPLDWHWQATNLKHHLQNTAASE